MDATRAFELGVDVGPAASAHHALYRFCGLQEVVAQAYLSHGRQEQTVAPRLVPSQHANAGKGVALLPALLGGVLVPAPGVTGLSS